MFKNIFFFASAFLLNVLCAADTMHYGFVNIEAVFQQALEPQKKMRELEAAKQKLLADEEAARKAIESEMITLQNSAAKMNDKARADKETELRTRVASMQADFSNRRADLTQKEQTILADAENKIRLISESVAKKHKPPLPIVINEAVVLYMADDMKKNYSITSKVVAELNKAYPVVPEKPADKKKVTPANKGETKK